MVGANVVSGARQAAAATLLITGSAEIWHLAALAAVNGGASAFFFPASAGVVPQTVPAPLLQQANALLALAMNSAVIGGAALGGFLVAAFGPGWAIAIDAATYLLGACFVARCGCRRSSRARAPSFLRELATGWREFRSRTWLWVIVLQFSFLLMVIGRRALRARAGRRRRGARRGEGVGRDPDRGGGRPRRRRPARAALPPAADARLGDARNPVDPAPLVALGFPLSFPAIPAAAFVAGLGSEIFGLLWHTTMQQEIPADKLSRVYSYDALGSIGLVPIGLALAGPVAEPIGVRATLWGAAAIGVAVTLAVLLVRDVRTLERREPAGIGAPA